MGLVGLGTYQQSQVESGDTNTFRYLPTIRKYFAETTLSKSTVTRVLILPMRLSFFFSFFSSFAVALVVEILAFALPFVELAVVSDCVSRPAACKCRTSLNRLSFRNNNWRS